MINQVFLNERIELIQNYIEHLDIITSVSLDELKKDFIGYYAVERVYQLIVDEIIDINSHIIKNNNLESPDDFQSTFAILGENNILPSDFAERITPIVGLRNRLVHRYERIDRKLALEMVYKEKEDFKMYIKLIKKYFEK